MSAETQTLIMWRAQQRQQEEYRRAYEAQVKRDFPVGTLIRWEHGHHPDAALKVYRTGVVTRNVWGHLEATIKKGGRAWRVEAWAAEVLPPIDAAILSTASPAGEDEGKV